MRRLISCLGLDGAFGGLYHAVEHRKNADTGGVHSPTMVPCDTDSGNGAADIERCSWLDLIRLHHTTVTGHICTQDGRKVPAAIVLIRHVAKVCTLVSLVLNAVVI